LHENVLLCNDEWFVVHMLSRYYVLRLEVVHQSFLKLIIPYFQIQTHLVDQSKKKKDHAQLFE